MSGRRGRQSPSPGATDGLSKRFKALDLAHPKQKISKLFGKPAFLSRWAAISQHDPYLKQPNHQGQSSSDKPQPTIPQGSSQAAPTQPVYFHQPPTYPPADPNARPSNPPYGLPGPPALIQMPSPPNNYAPNNMEPTYGQPPHPGGFMASGAYWVAPSQAPYIAMPYPSGEHVRAP